MKIKYQDKRLSDDKLYVIGLANTIVNEYTRQGFRLTLRQLYYQMIARDLFPNSWIDSEYNIKHSLQPDTKNTLKNYKRFGKYISDGRRSGLISWIAIEDRTRTARSNQHWDNPKQIVKAAMNGYFVDRWVDQPWYIEVWVEKDALIGVIGDVCDRLDVRYFATRGYCSDSEMWGAARRLIRARKEGKKCLLIHMSDHDPSGVDMTRDADDRLELFGATVQIKRIALTMAQIRQYNPPPNPAKLTDSRAKDYMRQFGRNSWELDALEPSVLANLIESTITPYIDQDKLADRKKYEKEGLDWLKSVLGEHSDDSK